MKFSELQKVLKERLGIEHLADIARELGVSAQAVSNWKSRGNVPYKYVAKIRENNIPNHLSGINVNSPKKIKNNTFDGNSEENIISLLDILLIISKQFRIIILIPSIFSFLMILYVQLFAER